MPNPLSQLLDAIGTGASIDVHVVPIGIGNIGDMLEALPQTIREAFGITVTGDADMTTQIGVTIAIQQQARELDSYTKRLWTLHDLYAMPDSAKMNPDATARADELEAWLGQWNTNVIGTITDAIDPVLEMPETDPQRLAALLAAHEALSRQVAATKEVYTVLRDRQHKAMLECPVDDILWTSMNTPPQDPFRFNFSPAATPPGQEAVSPEHDGSGEAAAGSFAADQQM